MELVETGIILLFWVAAVGWGIMALKRQRDGNAIKEARYRCTEEFFVVKKRSRKSGHDRYRWFYIATRDGKWEHTLSADKEVFKKTRNGDSVGRRDIYAPSGKQAPFISVKAGEKPELTGNTQKYEMIMCIVVAIICMIASIVVKDLLL